MNGTFSSTQSHNSLCRGDALETCVSVYHVCAAHGSLIALPVDVSVVKSDVRL